MMAAEGAEQKAGRWWACVEATLYTSEQQSEEALIKAENYAQVGWYTAAVHLGGWQINCHTCEIF